MPSVTETPLLAPADTDPHGVSGPRPEVAKAEGRSHPARVGGLVCSEGAAVRREGEAFHVLFGNRRRARKDPVQHGALLLRQALGELLQLAGNRVDILLGDGKVLRDVLLLAHPMLLSSRSGFRPGTRSNGHSSVLSVLIPL